MKHYEVKIEIWKESFSGHDYLDNILNLKIDAANTTSAEKKAMKIAFPSAGRGYRWSQSQWARNISIKEIG